MNEPKPRFTVIFIPDEILDIEELTSLEKMLLPCLSTINCDDDGRCHASNKELAEILNVKENTISKSMTKLRSMGLIKDISFDGRKRVISSQINPEILGD